MPAAQEQLPPPLEVNKNRSRGLRKLTNRMTDITSEIQERIERNEKVKILEVGCGYGKVLLQLRQGFGDQVELYGINRSREYSDLEGHERMASEMDQSGEVQTNGGCLPQIYYFDVCKPWPLPSDSFDVIF